MKNIYCIFFFFMFTCGSAFAQKQFVIDPNASPRELDGTFTKIKISGSIDLYLSQSENEGMAVSASEDKYKENIKTVIDHGELNISYQNVSGLWERGKKKLRVYVAMKTLERLEASGASDVVIAGTLSASTLTIHLSGASDFTGDINANVLNIAASGASDTKISGSVQEFNATCSGASDIKGMELKTGKCTIVASGASDIYISVSKELTGKASGASSIYYKGNPVVKNVESSGASTVASRNR
ncbi:MAG: DUF2807 domain-containing protein [Niastella sp.]|nr:DUF2807 domain-containing protein [Niastella sp.]